MLARRLVAAVALSAAVACSGGSPVSTTTTVAPDRNDGPDASPTTARARTTVPLGSIEGCDAPRPLKPPAVSSLSVSEKAAAIVMVGVGGATTADAAEVERLTQAGIGGIFVARANLTSIAQARALTDGIRAASPLGVLIGIDEEGGRVARTSTLFDAVPSARTLGKRGDDAARAAGESVGERLFRLGIDLAFAPVADLDGGPAGGIIGDRSFSAVPDVAADRSAAFLAGLRSAGVMGSAKHFPGYGSADDTHGEVVESPASETTVRSQYLVPFRRLIAGGVDTVMVGHLAYDFLGDGPASLEPATYRLIRRLGFDGPVITDSLGMAPVFHGRGYAGAAVATVAAGADIVLAASGGAAGGLEMRDALVEAVRSGDLDEARLDEAVGQALSLRRHWSPCSAATDR